MSFVPTPLITAIRATAMPVAIKPYSMAVAPDSSLRKALSFVGINWLWALPPEGSVKLILEIKTMG